MIKAMECILNMITTKLKIRIILYIELSPKFKDQESSYSNLKEVKNVSFEAITIFDIYNLFS